MGRPLCHSIADWLVPWKRCDWPVDWAARFGRKAPLALEIGFGNGEFLEREARRRPERDHLGVELSWTSATHLFRRLDRGGLANVRAVLGEASNVLHYLIEPGALVEVFVNHPCPWPKERHHRRRLIRAEFLALLADRMTEAAPLTIVTDHAEYADWVRDALETQSWFEPRLGTTEVAELPGRETTKYQRKAMAEGIPIHYFPWRKAASPDSVPPRAAFDDLDAMPSLTLQGAFDAERLFDGFATSVHRESHRDVETVVKLVAAYRRENQRDKPVGLVEALVKEDKLRQEFALQVVGQPDGKLLVKLSGLGDPHPTFGVKRAVWRLGEWLREHHPELAVVHHNLGEEAAR